MLVAEDDLSMAVARRVVRSSTRSFSVTRQLVTGGFGRIKSSVPKYRQASRVIPHVVLTDLDRAACPASLRRDWSAEDLPNSMLLRVAVREMESWILGDRHGFSAFVGISPTKVPRDPESLPDPKEALLNIVTRSRNRALKEELMPPRGSRVSIGPLYNERLSGFVESHWDIEAAGNACPSLRRMRDRLERFLA